MSDPETEPVRPTTPATETEMEFQAQHLAEENDELKMVNIQYQASIRLVASKNRELSTENKKLRDENKELTDKLNHLKVQMEYLARRSKPAEPAARNLSIGDATRRSNGEACNPFEGKVEDNQIPHLLKTVERYKGMYQSWKLECEVAERKAVDLEEKYLELQRQKVKTLEKDPRITQKINSEKDRKIQELTKLNLELQARLHGSNEEASVDLSCVKKEKPTTADFPDTQNSPAAE